MSRGRAYAIGEQLNVVTRASVDIPQNRRWLIKTISVRMVTSAVPGNRRQVTEFFRGPQLLAATPCPFNTGASKTMVGQIAVGVPESSSVTEQTFTSPAGEVVCVGNESIQCRDLNSIDPAGDRFHVRVFADTERGR